METQSLQRSELKQGLEPRPILELRSEVVDQIAAGEVVERPSHLVKELIENSMDAGANEISIEVENGGRNVVISDDGVGIRSGDLTKALSRHATSKIQSANDLWSLNSFGFRGEALASIAAVSRLEVTSRPHREEIAYRIHSQFGVVSGVEPSAGNPGTVIVIKDLFENVPARLKFLKSETAETSQIRLVVKALALSRPDISFRLRVNGKSDLSFLSEVNAVSRSKTVLSVPLYQTQGQFEGVEVDASIAGPNHVMGNGKGLWLFVHDRWVQDRTVQAAVSEAFRGLLMHGEYPIGVVKLKLPPGEVDVNIHPTKSAVKFRDPSRVFRAVSKILRQEIERAPWMNDGSRGASAMGGATPEPLKNAPSSALKLGDFVREYTPKLQSVSSVTSAAEMSSGVGTVVERYASLQVEQNSENPLDPRAPSRWSQLKVVGQVGLTYIVCEERDKLVLIDQHAAHERVAYERLMRAWKEGGIETQPLLIPMLLDFEPEAVEVLLQSADELNKVGLQIESIGPRTLAIGSVPALLKESAVQDGLREFAERSLERGGSFAIEHKFGDVFARMACHSVVRAGQVLTHEQMVSLLEQMDEFPLSSFCPHGRPVSVEYPFQRLERDFGRTV